MGLGLETFLDLTPQQFLNAYNAFLDKIEADDLQAERRARMQVFKMLCPPGGKRISVFDLWYIKGDEKFKQQIRKKQKPSTRQRFNELIEKWK